MDRVSTKKPRTSPKPISEKMMNTLSIMFFIIAFLMALSYIYSSFIQNSDANACSNVICDSYCLNAILYTAGHCEHGTCIYNPQFCKNGCSNGKCNSFASAASQQKYDIRIEENTEPSYSNYCDRINPYDISVREAAANAIRNHPGVYSIDQLFDIYDWVKQNIIYQNVPLAGIPYQPSETLSTKSGDCKNQAVLMASMIGAIGGRAKVIIDPVCVHAYAIVDFGSSEYDIQLFAETVAEHYGSEVQVNYFTENGSIWVYFDPAGGDYPGNLLSSCSGNRTIYSISSCLECVHLYPNMPYSLGDMCYSKCPAGTITINNYTCTSCLDGYTSCNNQCLTCSDGNIVGNDCLCHEPCGSNTTYCTSGACCDGKCISCYLGYLGEDCKCHY